MRFIDCFNLAYNNLKNRKFRTFTNVFGIGIGVMLIVTLVSIGSGVQNYFLTKTKELNNLRKITILPQEYKAIKDLELELNGIAENSELTLDNIYKKKSITEDVMKKLDSNEYISDYLVEYNEVVNEVLFNDKAINDISLASYKDSIFLIDEVNEIQEKSTNSRIRSLENNNEYILYGDILNSDDTNSILLPEEFVRITLAIDNIEDIIDEEIELKYIISKADGDEIFSKKVKVKGIINSKYYQPHLVVSLDVMKYFKEVKGLLVDNEMEIDKIQLMTNDYSTVREVCYFIEDDLRYNYDSVQVVADSINKVMIIVKILLSIIGIIVIGIASLDVVNTMIMTMYERQRSIGLMRAVGCTKRQIRKIFLTEGIIIGIASSIFGIALSYGNLIPIKFIVNKLAYYIDTVNQQSIDNFMLLDVKIALITVISTIILTILASLYPANKAAKLDPIEVLKMK